MFSVVYEDVQVDFFFLVSVVVIEYLRYICWHVFQVGEVLAWVNRR